MGNRFRNYRYHFYILQQYFGIQFFLMSLRHNYKNSFFAVFSRSRKRSYDLLPRECRTISSMTMTRHPGKHDCTSTGYVRMRPTWSAGKEIQRALTLPGGWSTRHDTHDQRRRRTDGGEQNELADCDVNDPTATPSAKATVKTRKQLTNIQRQQLLESVEQYNDVFTDQLECTQIAKHCIVISDETPCYQPSYHIFTFQRL